MAADRAQASGTGGDGSGWKGLEVDVSLPFPAGELVVRLHSRSRAVALVGPSGSGKSTVLRVLAGVEPRARGTVSVNGRQWHHPTGGIVVPPWERRVGWVPQESLLFPHLSVRENLAYAGATETDVAHVAGRLQVDHLLDRRPRRLSGGERQRVALGRALLSSPQLLLLDEPFSALHRPLRMDLAARLRAWTRERGVPLVLVSHDEEDADILADERWDLIDGGLRPGHG